jgi:hypothetical protein
MPALRDIHEAPHHVAVLKRITGVRRFAPAALREKPHSVVVFGDLACGVVLWRSAF